ncbi:unnamed protein product [Clonostachys rosea f. rosea IK726]|uniref:Uncharacterized protein n=1 Tax=Clonostachys rosea f. rosea IK726 TaxID=1349383 RepID=A0ACA9USN4_BIOOC|nr:unnamed protein product [Clonostachys rosea f. rosea IK726]
MELSNPLEPFLAHTALFTSSLGSSDSIVIFLITLVAIRYLSGYLNNTKTQRSLSETSGKTGARSDQSDIEAIEGEEQEDQDRSIVQALRRQNRRCAVIFGSQTGTAEAYASRLSQDGRSTFSLTTMTCDAEEYDWADDLHNIGSDQVLIFVLASYGEGEPTDNAADLYEAILGLADQTTGRELPNLIYAAFGLGNKTYEHYNKVVHDIDGALQKLGARRLGPVGEGDDAGGTMEEDFLSWKAIMWDALSKHLGLEEHQTTYKPMLEVLPRDDLSLQSPSVYLGETTAQQLKGLAAPAGPHQPFVATVSESRELFRMSDRNCIHMEMDLAGSGLQYQTGDHIAVWPMNSSVEVDRFLNVNGLLERRDSIIDVRSMDPTAKLPCPTPTTYDTIARYYLEISSIVSRELLARFAPLAPSEEARDMMVKLNSDADYFTQTVTSRYLNLAQVLEMAGGGKVWSSIPFAFYLEGLSRLRPRYYSISSSSLLHPQRVSITAVVDTANLPNRSGLWKGVASNYLLAIKQGREADSSNNNATRGSEGASAYTTTGPRGKYGGSCLPVHIRASKFRLPDDPATPIVMVGPGTGVAPFRAFLQERVAQVKANLPVGKTILFYGCRNSSQDFLYQDEFEEHKKVLQDRFHLITAFSREGGSKVYVQHRLKGNAAQVASLLTEGGHFYVCGNAAKMAQDVHSTLVQIMGQHLGGREEHGLEYLRAMRASRRYQEDTW